MPSDAPRGTRIASVVPDGTGQVTTFDADGFSFRVEGDPQVHTRPYKVIEVIDDPSSSAAGGFAKFGPLPPPAADWREWLRWMAGVNPALPPPPPDFPSNPIRFDRRHATAMRFVEAYTGYRQMGYDAGIHRGLPSRRATFIISIGPTIEVPG